MIYVTMIDKFMSGWGPASDKMNRLVISCNDEAEAAIVFKNASNRDEMRQVKISDDKPCYAPDQNFVSEHGREQDDYQKWFEEGAFV